MFRFLHSALPEYDTAEAFLSFNQSQPFFRQQWDNGKTLARSPEAEGAQAQFGDLFGPNGSEVARQHRSQLLASAIPALSHAIGHEPLGRLEEWQNINLNDANETFGGRRSDDAWPTERDHFTLAYRRNFLHSDLRDIPYFYNYPAYDRITESAQLR